MSLTAFLSHLLFALSVFGCSSLICFRLTTKHKILDIPNQRSSHVHPTPKSGGLGIVFSFLAGVVAVYTLGDTVLVESRVMLGFVASSLLIALVSFVDDLRTLSYKTKFPLQIIAVFIAIASGISINEMILPGIGRIELGGWGDLLTLVWFLGLTNAYNFMDGIDGIAAGTAIIGGSFLCALAFSQGSYFVYMVTYALIAGAAGFMLFNFPKAKLFMGDVGSAFLGFVFAALAVIGATNDRVHLSLFILPMLLLAFIWDSSFTFLRRLIRGENVFEAHRSHLYQLLNQLGFSHVKVSGIYFLFALIHGFGAWWSLTIEGDRRLLVFAPFLLIQVIFSVVVVKKARARKIL